MPAFSNLGHVALKVRDLEASVAFYEKLGFPEFLRLTEEDGSAWIIYIKFDDNLYLELFPGGTNRVDQQATGTNHLCLTVHDIEEAVEHLEMVGIQPTVPLNAAKRGVDNNRGMWIEDPDGNRIEVMEMADDCIQWAAIEKLKAGGGKTSLVAPLHGPKKATA